MPKVASCWFFIYEGWDFNSGNYLFTTDTKQKSQGFKPL